MVRIRPAVASDGDFLVRVLQMAADWRPSLPPRTLDEVLARIGEPMERQLRADIARAFADLPDIGGTQIVIHGETYGAFLAHSPGQPWAGNDDLVLVDRWASLRLTHADALAFQHELDELFARYEYRSGPQSYSLHLRLVASARGAASR